MKVALKGLGLVVLLMIAGRLSGQLTRWEGPAVESEGWVDSGSGFLGWLWCDTSGQSPWAYPLSVGQYVYLPPDYLLERGGWGYFTDLGRVGKVGLGAAPGWVGFAGLDGSYFVSVPEVEPSGWVYLMNSGADLPLGPSALAVMPQHSILQGADTVEERFADAIRLGPPYIERFADYDLDVYMTRSARGVSFLNPLAFPGGNANRYVRLGFNEASGYLNFRSLDGISGEARVVVRADVDLSQTTNGFYVRVKKDDVDIAAYERLGSGEVHEDILLEPYLTMGEDEAYVEITLPWQSEITIREVYLHMDTQVSGFSDMDERITGGTGAVPEDIYRVTNASEFVMALESIRASGEPSIIEVAGAIRFEDWEAAGQSGREASIGSDMANVSIIGIGSDALFDGVGILVQGRNVIIQNVTMRYVLARDAIQINNGQYVKIDHCTLYNESFDINPDKDKFDELISIKNDASHVIVSWNEIYDSHKTILVGSNDEVDALPDRKVIFHHNWFHDTGSRHPLYRGGHAHVYNNFYERVNSAIDVRTNAKLLIENNYFKEVRGSIGYYPDASGGIEVRGNHYDNVGGTIRTESTIDIQFAGDYQYDLDAANDVPDLVRAGAGAGKP